MLELEVERWSVADAAELYEVARWGNGYFSVNRDGHVCVHPTKDPERSIDLKQLVDRLQLRGIDLPILIRFADILKHRLGEIHGAFQTAMTEQKYQGNYCCVYPIKVNQQRQVVEEVLEFGKPYKFGLEAGSKPELLAVVAMASNDTPIICNGFKDAEFIETAMLAHKIGRNIIPVVEKYTELGLILEYAEKIGVRPKIGMRVKLAARGSGRWQSSGGYRSKFGLTVTEIAQRPGRTEKPRHAGLLQAAAFPSRKPDHEHPAHQSGAERSGPCVYRIGHARARVGIHRRRRRVGNRLRRFANQLRIERELQPAGIRQRRGVSHPTGLRRRQRAASDDHFRKRPRRGGLSQRAGVWRAGRIRARAKRHSAANCRRKPSSR